MNKIWGNSIKLTEEEKNFLSKKNNLEDKKLAKSIFNISNVEKAKTPKKKLYIKK
jgi:hypothetical protein